MLRYEQDDASSSMHVHECKMMQALTCMCMHSSTNQFPIPRCKVLLPPKFREFLIIIKWFPRFPLILPFLAMVTPVAAVGSSPLFQGSRCISTTEKWCS